MNKLKTPPQPIYVTRPFLPPMEEYVALLNEVWTSGILTHNGPLVQRLERELVDFLKAPNIVAVTNGTIALQIAIRAFDLQGEILTTPFSWIATCSAIRWERCEPVFVDVDPRTYNMDPAKIEERITDKTVAIMPVHTFGNPCDVTAIQQIADKHGLKVIYDGAHALGTTVNGQSVLDFGDITATSFHATKLFQTAEGGSCTAPDEKVAEKLRRLRFFGHDAEKNIVEDGFNGKMTEVHAAMGIAVLKYFDAILESRKHIAELYRKRLQVSKALQFQRIEHGESNYSYMPVVFETEQALLRVEQALKTKQIFPRRYFYPSLNTVDIIRGHECPASESLAKRILCLPSYHGLSDESIDLISDIVLDQLG